MFYNYRRIIIKFKRKKKVHIQQHEWMHLMVFYVPLYGNCHLQYFFRQDKSLTVIFFKSLKSFWFISQPYLLFTLSFSHRFALKKSLIGFTYFIEKQTNCFLLLSFHCWWGILLITVSTVVLCVSLNLFSKHKLISCLRTNFYPGESTIYK